MLKCSALIAVALCPFLLYADVVELTTGEKLEGEVIARDESGVTLKVPYGKIIIENKFVKEIIEDEANNETDKNPSNMDKNAKETEAEAKKLKWRLERWMNNRNKLICKKCGGDGNNKCSACNGTGQQPADPHARTMRGCIPCRAKGILGPCKSCKGAGFDQKYIKTVFWDMKTKKFRDKMTAMAGKVNDYLKKLASELRSGSHEHSSWVKPFSTFKVDNVTIDGDWGSTSVTVVYDAASGTTSSEELRWKKEGSQWYLASEYDEEDE